MDTLSSESVTVTLVYVGEREREGRGEADRTNSAIYTTFHCHSPEPSALPSLTPFTHTYTHSCAVIAECLSVRHIVYSCPQTPPSHEEKRSGEPRRIFSWLGILFATV